MDMIMRVVWWLLGFAMVAGVVLFVFIGVGRAEDAPDQQDWSEHPGEHGYPPVNPRTEDRDFDHDIVLTITVVTPGTQPNIDRSIKQKSLNECWESAKAWVQTENIGQKVPNAIGVGAGCGIVKRPSQEP